jgi:hypothetical protein
MMALFSGHRGSGLAFAGHGGVGSGAEEQFDALGAAGFGRIHQRGLAGKVPGIDFSASIQEQPHCEGIGVLGETIERTPAQPRLLSRRISPRIQESGDHRGFGSRCVQQRREPVEGAGINGRSGLQQEFHDRQMVEHGGMQSGPAVLVSLVGIAAGAQQIGRFADIPLRSGPHQRRQLVDPLIRSRHGHILRSSPVIPRAEM